MCHCFALFLYLKHLKQKYVWPCRNTPAIAITPNYIVVGNVRSLLVTLPNHVLYFVILQELELVKTLLVFVTICDFL